MNKIIFGGIFLLGISIYSYAGLAEPIASKVADILTAKINADKDVAIEAVKSASTITIGGETYHYVTMEEMVVLIHNSRNVLLCDFNIGNIIDVRKDCRVINNHYKFIVGYDSEDNKTIEKEK